MFWHSVLCGHNTEYVYSNMYTWTINVILVKYCLCGSLMMVYANRNMLEQLLWFEMF
jgi:hypothetical protein